MRNVCYISLSVAVTLTIVLGMSLFDIITVADSLRNILGLIDVVAIALFFKTFIRIYKYTHKD